MEKEFIVINSFSGENLMGNPAAIFLDPSNLKNHTLQSIAKQINLVETVFVYPSYNADFRFRYFTPHNEVSLAGHPTIAACIALVNAKKIDPNKKNTYQIETQNGLREIVIETVRNQVLVKMKQSSPKFISPLISKKIIANTLGIHEADIASNLPIQTIDLGVKYLVVAVNSLSALMSVKRDVQLLHELCENLGVREVQVFTFKTYGEDFDFHTRNLCPREGIEDPACGLGNAAVGAYLAQNYYNDQKFIHLRAEQGTIVKMPCLIELFISKKEKDIELYIGGTGKKVVEGKFFI
ncbi:MULTISPECIES: PhzF family phenazine biosynthesis protein [unclassified Bacillus (in: firmicutes)]|uniref:PhzF family phenazine biosynthesis protein n=1 Tax=unclassified Bacillus (in: firmicutes) TaxID=185979 RepID=UPI0008EEE044|nr:MULTISPECIES: PhzF family phenazine biosynthesis protein [unclassified Bacillus (in: firmicutes)]SFI70101.1 phenazine biosynthesis protein PhzF family [Bacillus sp. 71mf]SFS89609.1 phenazine biosynthesis protein PhzF family [Bacillus sp. 103mf]